MALRAILTKNGLSRRVLYKGKPNAEARQAEQMGGNVSLDRIHELQRQSRMETKGGRQAKSGTRFEARLNEKIVDESGVGGVRSTTKEGKG